jgi:hypothetical protein
MAEANVKNLEGLEIFAAAVVRLCDGNRKNTDDVREQLQRVSVWLTKEMPEYWANQLRISQNRWTEAREDLLRCQSRARADDEESCLVQRKALERAAARRALCEQRVKILPVLASRWDQYLQEISLAVRQMEDLSEAQLPLAHARLQKMISTLKQYIDQSLPPTDHV